MCMFPQHDLVGAYEVSADKGRAISETRLITLPRRTTSYMLRQHLESSRKLGGRVPPFNPTTAPQSSLREIVVSRLITEELYFPETLLIVASL
jgi:hypothetical protein